MTLRSAATSALLLGVALSGCATPGFVAVAASPPEVERLGPAGARLRMELVLASTFALPLHAQAVDYEIWLHGSPVMVGSASLDVQLPAGGTALLQVPLLADLSGGLPHGVARRLARASPVPLTLRGVVHLRSEDGDERSASFDRTLPVARVVGP